VTSLTLIFFTQVVGVGHLLFLYFSLYSRGE